MQKNTDSKSGIRTAVCLALTLTLASLLGSPQARAAAINFQTPVACAADTDVKTGGGNQLFAFTWGGAATVNGLPFTATAATVNPGFNLYLASFTGANATVFTANAAPFNTLSASYSNILRGAVFTAAPGTGLVTLTNLVPGRTYFLQLWASDPRAIGTNRVQDISAAGGPAVRLDYNSAIVAGGVGQYTWATFTADADSQEITLDGVTPTSPDAGAPQINAFQLRDISGVWSGTTSGNWDDSDSTSQNFSGSSFTSVKAATTEVYFGDKDATGNPVANSSITVGAGGVTGVNAIFNNSSVIYTLTSADATGITGAYGVTVRGGTATLNGANTYSGTTTINGGGSLVLGHANALGGSSTIVLDSAILDSSALPALTLGSSRTLRGAGTIRGSLEASSGATLIPGNAGVIGTLTVTNNLTLNGQTITFDLPFSPFACDRIAVGNTLTLNGNLTLSLNYLNGSLAGGTYTLMTFASLAGGTVVLDTAYPGVTLNVNPTSVTLTVGGGGGGTSGAFTNLLGGTWGAATNWLGNTIATNIDGIADFSTLDLTAARTVTINGVKTIGNLIFGDTAQSHNWTLGTGTNILSVSSGSPKILVNSGQNTTISASLQGTQGFTKLGAGTLTLTGANRLTNAVNVQGGTLTLSAANPFGPTTGSAMVPLTLSNAVLQVTGAYLLTNNLTVPAGTSNYISQLNTSAGLYGTAGGPISGDGVLTLNAAGQNPRLNGGANHNFTGTLRVNASGTGGLLTSFDDDPALAAFGTAGSSNAVFEFNGGSQYYMATTDWVGKGRPGATNYLGELRGSGATLYANNGRSGVTTLEIGGRNTDSTFSGNINDNRQGVSPYTPTVLRKVGTGKLTLGGTSGYTGGTEVRNGTLVVSGTLGNTPVNVYSGGAFQLDGSIGSATVNVQAGGRLVLGAGAGLGAAALTMNGLMDTTASGGLFNLGSASLSGSGVVTGSVTLATSSVSPGPIGGAGTLAITNGDFTATGGTLAFDLSNTPGGGNDLLDVTGNLDLSTPGVVININKVSGALGSGTYVLAKCGGTLSGTVANLTLIGANPLDVLQFNGQRLELVVSSVPNLTWTGDGLANQWNIGASTTWLNGGVPSTFANGNSVTFDNTGSTNPVVDISVAVEPSAITVAGSSNYTFAGTGDITNGTTLIKGGTGTLTVLNTNSFVGTIFVNIGTLAVGNAGTNGHLSGNITNGGALVYTTPLDQVMSNSIIGSGTLTKLGAGVLTLNADSTLSGPTLISAGALSIGDGVSTAGSLGTGRVTNNATLIVNRASSLTMSNAIHNQGALVNVAAGPVVLAGVISGNGVVTNDFGGSLLELAASNTYSGGTYLNGGTVMLRNLSGFGSGNVVMDDSGAAVIRMAPTAGVTNVIPNNIKLPASSSPQFVVTDLSFTSIGTVRLPGLISGGAAGTDTRIVNGGGLPVGNSRLAVVLENAANSFTMNPEVYSGCLAFTSDGALGSTDNDITVRASTTAPFTDTLSFIGLRFDAANITLNPARTIHLIGTENINVQTFDGTIAGPITGVGLNKLGSGTLTLNGPGSLTGTTTVRAGTLAINNVFGGAFLDVLSGATLTGTGTIEAAVSLVGNSTLAPGSSIGTLTVSNSMAMSTTSTNAMEINAGTLACDKVVIGLGTLYYGGTLNVVNNGGTLAQGQSFQLFSATNVVGNFAATNLPALNPANRWSWNPASGTLSVVANVNTTPTNLTAVVSGSNLDVSWPADQIGWRLEVQTNSLGVGISGNWATWPGSTTTNAVSVPINPANPTVFIRLVYP